MEKQGPAGLTRVQSLGSLIFKVLMVSPVVDESLIEIGEPQETLKLLAGAKDQPRISQEATAETFKRSIWILLFATMYPREETEDM